MTKRKENKYMTVKNFCERLDCSYAIWTKLVISGEAPPYFKVGKNYKIPVSSFEKWFQGQIIHPNVEI